MNKPIKAVVLAAGKGTRLRTEGIDLPKVMRIAAGKPLLAHVLEALSFLDREDIVLVAGYEREKVMAAFPDYTYAVQDPQLGTGHAVQCAKEALEGFHGSVLICCGDMPLLRRETYEALCEAHKKAGNACTILSTISDRVLPYGRVIRNADGSFARIVEDRDCTPQEKACRELNVAVYLFEADALWNALSQLRCDNAQKEYYLTDAPALIQAAGGKVGATPSCTAEEMLGVNTVEQLAQVEEILRAR